jgi:glycosyltransferase involved in cell wall biosynthesis
MTTPRLRVAHISLGLDVGGQEKLLLEFVRHADRTRFEPVIIVLGTPGRLAPAFKSLGCRVVAMNEAPGLRPLRVLRLKRLLQEERIDIVHTHDDAPLVYGMPAARWAGIASRRLREHNRREELLERWASRFAQRFICVSHDSARYVQSMGVRPDIIDTIHNGIDLSCFPFHGPRPVGPAVTVARLSPEKDIAGLIEAARRVVDKVPDFRLQIAGDGACRGDLERQTEQLGLRDHILFLGEISDVPALLGRARLFVLPSRTEGVSLTILEAMARGLPVVATHVGGNPEVVLQENSGLLVPAGNASALAHAITRIYRHPETGGRMGLAGRRRVEAHFDVRTMVARYEALYQQQPAPQPLAAPLAPEVTA